MVEPTFIIIIQRGPSLKLKRIPKAKVGGKCSVCTGNSDIKAKKISKVLPKISQIKNISTCKCKKIY